MFDLLAAISSVDPPSLVAWAVLVFAAGMYPVGIMFGGSCSPCCNSNPCSACTEGELPDTVTVSISGYVDGQVQKCCADYWNGKAIVLKRGRDWQGSLDPCSYRHAICGTSCDPLNVVAFRYNGPNAPPVLHIMDPARAAYNFNGCTLWPIFGDDLIANCSSFSITATHQSGVTVTVSSGGEYDPFFIADNGTGRCSPCCRGEDDPADEIEAIVYEGNAENDTWHAPFRMESAPTVVLRKGVDGTLDEGSYFGYCNTIWGGSLPNGYKVVVWVSKCDANQTDCDHCWKKCHTRARVQTIFNCYGTSNPDRGNSPACEHCEDSPMCSPVAGDYVIRNNIFGDGLCIVGAVKVSVQ